MVMTETNACAKNYKLIFTKRVEEQVCNLHTDCVMMQLEVLTLYLQLNMMIVSFNMLRILHFAVHNLTSSWLKHAPCPFQLYSKINFWLSCVTNHLFDCWLISLIRVDVGWQFHPAYHRCRSWLKLLFSTPRSQSISVCSNQLGYAVVCKESRPQYSSHLQHPNLVVYFTHTTPYVQLARPPTILHCHGWPYLGYFLCCCKRNIFNHRECFFLSALPSHFSGLPLVHSTPGYVSSWRN